MFKKIANIVYAWPLTLIKPLAGLTQLSMSAKWVGFDVKEVIEMHQLCFCGIAHVKSWAIMGFHFTWSTNFRQCLWFCTKKCIGERKLFRSKQKFTLKVIFFQIFSLSFYQFEVGCLLNWLKILFSLKLLLIFLSLRIFKISYWTSTKSQSPKIFWT